MNVKSTAFVALLVVAGLSNLSEGKARKRLDMFESPSRGFVKEIDEPGTRGQLTRVSPADVDVAWRFALSHDSRSLVYSGRVAGTKGTYDLYRLDSGATAPVKITSGREEDSWIRRLPQMTRISSSGPEYSFWRIRSTVEERKQRSRAAAWDSTFSHRSRATTESFSSRRFRQAVSHRHQRQCLRLFNGSTLSGPLG